MSLNIIVAMSQNKLISIGRVIGPGEDSSSIRIQSKDNLHSRIGEFLIYEINKKFVFLVVSNRSLKKSLPDYYMAQVELSAEDIAETLGIENSLEDIEYELTASILGYFDENLNALVNPRINPEPNTLVFLAPDEELEKILFLKKQNEIGSAEIGELLLRNNIKAFIDMDEMISTHFSILAGTGSGKSYLARVIIEEFMKPQNRASICIFDPHGEYSTFSDDYKGISVLKDFRQNSYSAKTKVLIPGYNLKIKISDLRESELKPLLFNLTEKMEHELFNVLKRARKKANKRNSQEWTYKDFTEALEDLELENEEEIKQNKQNNTGTLDAIKWRFEKRFGQKNNKTNLFSDTEGTVLRDIFEVGQCTIIDLSRIEEEEQQVLSSVIISKAYEALVRNQNNEVESNGFENSLDHPVLILLEEAHRFAPVGQRDKISNSVLRKVLAEGRKFGIGVGLITQRPGKLDQDVLSQCMTQFLMRLINPLDQESVKQGVESAGRDLLRELPSLSKGQCIVCGSAVRTPVMLKIRKALTPHGGESKKASAIYFEKTSEVVIDGKKARKASFKTTEEDRDLWELE